MQAPARRPVHEACYQVQYVLFHKPNGLGPEHPSPPLFPGAGWEGTTEGLRRSEPAIPLVQAFEGWSAKIQSFHREPTPVLASVGCCALAQMVKRQYGFYEFEVYPGNVQLDMASRNQKSQKQSKVSAEKILAAALKRAGVEGWQNIRLHDIADDLGISLPVVRDHFRDQNAIADAWFRKSLDAMLLPTEKAFRDLPPKERLFLVIMRWLDAMAVHRRVTAQMIRAKLYPGHPHHWVPLVFNLSRLVHWIREAAFLDAVGRQRQFEEIGLSALVVTTLGFWATDQSEGQDRTRLFFRKRLETADRVMSRLFRS